ncbi:MAG TPA: phage major capsid protein [Candidatus Nanoarchaeia archaeon]|nr:phage major capsid protein [Candidatus Nanoarchaeia archaeon]
MNHYQELVTKQAELSALVAKMASENRGPNEDEKKQLENLQSAIKTIREDFESKGREAFLRNLETADPKSVVLKKDESFADHVKGTYQSEYDRLSLGRLLKGYILGDWTGAELEQKAMTSSPTTAGGILIPTPLSAQIIDLARNESVVMRAGATTVPMTSATLKIARQTSDVTAAWYAANATISESDAAFDSVDFTARKLACMVRVENELLEDAQGVDAAINKSIASAMGLEIDRVAMFGSGSAPEPQGLLGLTGVGETAAVGTLADYDKFVDAIYGIRGYNFEPNAIVYAPRTANKLAKLKTGLSGDKTPLAQPSDFAALAKFVSNQIPITQGAGSDSCSFLGKWDELMVGLRRNIVVEVSREADDVFAKDQTLIRCTWRGDVQVAHVKAFHRLLGIA